jgi:hypothetical protein
MHAAQPLRPEDRDGFLVALAERLKGCGEIGDGAVYRAIAEVQRQHFDPPVGIDGPIARRYATAR